jgi:predicted DNA-binding transcriptional regulator YafY
MPNTATRLITLIMLLQRQPNQKAAELAEKLGISVRSLHRYLDMLDEMGIPVYSERGPYGGFSLVRGYKMPPLIFTPEEATAICLGAGLVGELWGQLYTEAAQGALAKIENVLPDEQRGEVAWARRSLVTAQLQKPGLLPYAPLLETLRGAIRQQKQVRMVYQGNLQAEPLEREMDPYVLAYRQGWWYVIGHCQLRQAVRSFRVDRIRELERLEAGFQIPADFDAQKFLSFEIQSETQFRVRLHLGVEVAHLALSTPAAWEEISPQADGSVIVSTALPDLYWAASLALSYGPAATVLEPEELRRMVSDWARQIAANYADFGNKSLV